MPFVLKVRSSGPYSSSLSFTKPGAQSPPKGFHPGSCKSPPLLSPAPPASLLQSRTHSHLPSNSTNKASHSFPTQLPLGHLGAPIGRLRDRAGPERAAHHPAAALRPLLAALLGPMPVLRPRRTLAHMVWRRARRHADAVGRARGGDGIGSPRTCILFHRLL